LLTPIDKAQYQPWPTENAMRQGLLFQMEGSMSGTGQTGQIGDGQSLTFFSHGQIGTDCTENKQEDVVMAEVPSMAQVHREEQARRYDPEAVFTLDLNSDSDDE
jgi:mediator of RNA polymerase II transcription subunit 4